MYVALSYSDDKLDEFNTHQQSISLFLLHEVIRSSATSPLWDG